MSTDYTDYAKLVEHNLRQSAQSVAPHCSLFIVDFSKPGIANLPVTPPFLTPFSIKHFFSPFFTIFSAQNKAKPQLNTIYSIGGL
jgi:hypothetical protein